ncbi:hypothetical protein LINPERPRIM_LOCUS29081 [Linum perenne]
MRVVGTERCCVPLILLYVRTAMDTCIGVCINYPKAVQDWSSKPSLARIRDTPTL